MIPLFLALAFQLPEGARTDTLTLSLDAALSRAVAGASSLVAARSRTQAAAARTRQAGTWLNPTLAATAENLGAARQVTGISGLKGTEGQVLLGSLLPLGGDRSAALARSRAEERAAEAAFALKEADLRLELLEAVALAEQDRALARHAQEEAEGLQLLALTLQQQADAGRLSEGEAARARLASVSGWTELARAQAQAAASRTHLARLLGLDPTTSVVVEVPACNPEWLPTLAPLPEPALMTARVEVAQEYLREANAAAVPDLIPQVGLRRSAGFSALYMGLEISLPLFNRNRGTREAARLEVTAAREDAAAVDAELKARRAAALVSLGAVEAAGAHFTQDWRAALERTVESAETRFRLGEGTLTELLDSRRARLQALADFERWRAERLAWRARAARLSGDPMTGASLCAAADGTTADSTDAGIPASDDNSLSIKNVEEGR